MSLDQQTVTEALKQVIDPNTGKDFVAGRSIRNLAVGLPVRDGHVLVQEFGD